MLRENRMSDVKIAKTLLQHVEILSQCHPNRFAGEPEERAAVEYIRQQFCGFGLDTKVIQVPVMGWEVTSTPTLEVCAPVAEQIECAPFIFSGSTPPGGINGKLEYVGRTAILGSSEYEKFAICDLNTEQWLGFIVGSRMGPACSQPGPPAGFCSTRNGPHYTWPSCIIGKDDLAKLHRWLKRKKEIHVGYRVQSRFRPDAKSYTVEATVGGGAQERRILLGAHHDTMGAKGFPPALNSPGAMDNASGVAVVLEIARHFQSYRGGKRLTFCTFGGEERNFLMSSEYVRTLQEREELNLFDCCLIADGAAKGEVLRLISSTPADAVSPVIDLQEMTTAVLTELGLNGKYPIKRITPPPPRSDEWPFYLAGIPVFRAAWTQDYGNSYHRSGDTVEYCNDDERFVSVFTIYRELIGRLLVF